MPRATGRHRLESAAGHAEERRPHRMCPRVSCGLLHVVSKKPHRVYGHAKEGAAFGHAKIHSKPVLVRALSPLISVISTPLAASVLGPARLRGGSGGSARGASLAAEAIGIARDCGCTSNPRPVRLRQLQRRRHRGRPPQRRVLLRHHPHVLQHPGRDRPDRRGRLDRAAIRVAWSCWQAGLVGWFPRHCGAGAGRVLLTRCCWPRSMARTRWLRIRSRWWTRPSRPTDRSCPVRQASHDCREPFRGNWCAPPGGH